MFSYFFFLSFTGSNSDLSDATRSESNFIRDKKQCKRSFDIQDVNTYLDNISLRIDEISSQLNISIINQMKLMAFLLPHEREMMRPHNLPALPLKFVNDFWKFEKYLKDPENMSVMIKCISCYGNNSDEIKAMNIMKKIDIQLRCNVQNNENCDISKIKKACKNWLKQAPNQKQEIIIDKEKKLL
ncbi:hypothetical protein ACFW04_005423 [Cataglyphis niger]